MEQEHLTQPLITGTTHPLPFNKLSPRDFERLCLWLVGREGYERAEHLGLAGSEQGRDVVAYKPTPQGEELWYFQCKRYSSIGAKTLKDEVDKYLPLAQEKPHLRPVGVVFVVSCAASARVREEVGDYCKQHGLAYEFWALTELDMLVKRHPDIVKEFFQVDLRDTTVEQEARLEGSGAVSAPDIEKLEELIERGEAFRRDSERFVNGTVDPGVGRFGPQDEEVYIQWKVSCRLLLKREFDTSLAKEFSSIEERCRVCKINGERTVEPMKFAFVRWLDHYLGVLKAAHQMVKAQVTTPTGDGVGEKEKGTRITQLQELLDELPAIKRLHFYHPAFQEWHSTVKRRLRQIFGEDSYHVKEYDEIAWHTSDRPEDANEQGELYSRSCVAAEGKLRAAIRDLLDSQ